MAVHPVDQAWQRHAACRGPESTLFFPPAVSETRGDREARESRAKTICGGCPVQPTCLDYALHIQEPHGIWGGLTELERRVLLERRAG